MLSLFDLHIIPSRQALAELQQGKLLINTINAHSYNVAQRDALFAEALRNGDVLTADRANHHRASQGDRSSSGLEAILLCAE